jgi:hypothetical protein
MNTFSRTTTLAVALGAALLLGAANKARPVITGDADRPAMVGGTLHLELSLIEKGNGTLKGHGRQELVGSGGYLEFDITSYADLMGTMCIAGPVTVSVNSPFPVGATAVFCIEDNGNGGSGSPDRVSNAFAPPGLTIQDILMFFPGFLPPPDSSFLPITAGDFTIH